MPQEEINTMIISPEQVEENLRLIEDLKFFLATAPANWQKNQIIRRYYLNHDEGFVSCVYWNNLYFITGTDIVRCIVYRFEHFGRIITDRKKFEEGIFSDLRGLKCGTDAVLEASKSPFLEFLHRSSCLRTQKKQKVFFWFSVPHDKLFTDALERDLKKEAQDLEGTTRSRSEPSLSFKYDVTKNLSEQLLEFVKRDTPIEEYSQIEHTSDDNISQEISPQVVTFNDPEIELKDDEDFPLDFFPNQIGDPIDPSIFLNPPESYNEQSLLDQTYAKTPFFQTEFDKSAKGNPEEEEEEEFQDSLPQVYPQFYPIQSHMTNAQYYDNYSNGQDPFLQQTFFPSYPGMMPPYYYYPQQPPLQYDPFSNELFDNNNNNNGGFFVDDTFLNENPLSSPFGKIFPSFQATAPPQSPKNNPQIKRYKVGKNKHGKKQIQRSIINQQQVQKETPSSSLDDTEYNSLPTPESTVPLRQNNSVVKDSELSLIEED